MDLADGRGKAIACQNARRELGDVWREAQRRAMSLADCGLRIADIAFSLLSDIASAPHIAYHVKASSGGKIGASARDEESIMCRAVLCLIMLSLSSQPLAAERCMGSDCVYIEQGGPLPDEDFYQAVSCGAPPGDACIAPVFRFPSQDIGGLGVPYFPPVTIGFDWDVPSEIRDLPFRQRMVTLRTRDIIDEINALALGIALVEVSSRPQILITFDEERMDADVSSYAGRRGGAYFEFHSRQRCRNGRECPIDRGAVWINLPLDVPRLERLMRQEITQVLGLPYDLAGPYYFRGYKNGLCRTALNEGPLPTVGGAKAGFCRQDIAALRRHYPAAQVPRPKARPPEWRPAAQRGEAAQD